MHTPDFWHKNCAAAYAFAPLGWAFAAIGKFRRSMASPYRAPIPVICVGNVVAGGAGKTPICLWLGQYWRKAGKSVCFLSYGYGGIYEGPLEVNPHIHQALQVGDEGLLLSRTASTIIGHDRRGAAKLAVESGTDIIVMDDGFQNPFLYKDLSLLVLDGEYGLGNGRIIPAGPLRENIKDAMQRADAVVLYGEDRHGLLRHVPGNKPILRAGLEPDSDQINNLRGKKLIAFAGLGRPQKFFAMLRGQGLDVIAAHSFPDHHLYHDSDLLLLQEQAEKENAVLVTTAKDAVRFDPQSREKLAVVNVDVVWQDLTTLENMLSRLV